MTCPNCGAKIKEDDRRCPVCNADLGETVDFVEVLSTFNPVDIALVGSILDSEGIPHFFKGEQFFNIVRFAIDPVRLMVRRDDSDKVRELLKDLTLAYSVNGGEEQDESDDAQE